MLFLTKDRALAIALLEGLLKYWPFANCVKETLYLTELQEVLGQAIDKRKVDLTESIKQLGSYEIPIKLVKGIEPKIKVNVIKKDEDIEKVVVAEPEKKSE